jgi:hypothetical protein
VRYLLPMCFEFNLRMTAFVGLNNLSGAHGPHNITFRWNHVALGVSSVNGGH